MQVWIQQLPEGLGTEVPSLSFSRLDPKSDNPLMLRYGYIGHMGVDTKMCNRSFKRTGIVLILPVISSLLLASMCLAGVCWDAEGLALCENVEHEEYPRIIPDGQGGAIVIWQREKEEFSYDIYAQRIDASGKPLWGSDGTAVCDGEETEANPRVASDGAGGAFIAWVDRRSGKIVDYRLMTELYMQRIDSSGNPCWTVNGICVCDIDIAYGQLDIVPDGGGGAIIAWPDRRLGAESDLYAQRIDASGNPLWKANGITVCDSPGNQGSCMLTPDGAGGAVLAWNDERPGYGTDIYAQRVDSSGIPQWSANGVAICTADGYQLRPAITTDGTGGAIIAWEDRRTGGDYDYSDIYARRVDASGNPMWTPDGVAICTEEYAQDRQRIVSDGQGGAVISWHTFPGGSYGAGVYAQRVDAMGSPLWGANGITVCAGAGQHQFPEIAPDEGGGAIITWSDCLAPLPFQVYAQRISGSGIPLWEANGMAVCSTTYSQSLPAVASDGVGGGIFAWSDRRSDNWDIYAQRISDFKPVSTSYLAEGYTGCGFQEYICLGNPNPGQAFTVVTYMFGDGTTQTGIVQVPPYSRATVNVNEQVGEGREVSARIESDQDIVVERAMYFSYGKGWSGGHATAAFSNSTTWYFAEGYTGAGFDEWICVLNPGDNPAALTFDFQTEEEGHIRKEGYLVPAHSRSTFKVNDVLGSYYQASLALTSDVPVVAERPMYFDYVGREGHHWTGGHCVMGATALAEEYYFAEGTTRPGFDEWLTIQNPSPDSLLIVEATYMPTRGQGETTTKTYEVAAGTRYTVFVPDEVGEGVDVAVKLAGDARFLAERPIYFDYKCGETSAQGGHCVVGVAAPAAEWFLAEGFTGEDFDQWLCLLNPSGEEARVEITYFTQEAGALEPRRKTIPPNSRVTIMCNEHAGPGYQLSCGIEVLSGPDLVVERPMYFNREDWNGGHCSCGHTP
jgi:hypothetical protein